MSFSQSGYPKKIVLNNDSLVLITPKQMDVLNALHFKYEAQRSFIVAQNKVLDSCRVALDKAQSDYTNCSSIIEDYEAMIGNRDKIISANALLVSDQDRMIRRLKTQTGAIGVGAVIVLGSMLFLLHH